MCKYIEYLVKTNKAYTDKYRNMETHTYKYMLLHKNTEVHTNMFGNTHTQKYLCFGNTAFLAT